MGRYSWIYALPLALAATASLADDRIGDMFSFRGFGTAGIVRTNTNDAEYVPGGQVYGATKGLDYKISSDLGLQETVTPTQWLSATVQGLAQQRFRDTIEPKFEWAFVKVNPFNGLSVRAGQMALPTFLISDSRFIGFANNWITAPNQVYAQATFDTYKGADVTYQHSLGASTLTVSGLAGHTKSQLGSMATVFGHTLRGYSASWDAGVGTVRISHVQTQVDVFVSGFMLATKAPYAFDSVGGNFDHDNVVLQGEFIERRVRHDTASDFNGWYAFGGYRVGSWLPYAMFAKGTRPSGTATFPGIPFPIPLTEVNDHTTSIGVRADLIKSLDFKLQLDHAQGSSGNIPFTNGQPTFDNGAYIISVAVDFVF